MANTIKLKTGSGSDPSASDLIVGEIAIRTDSGKLFTKKDNGTVAEISGGGGIDDGDKGDITVSNGGDTFTIDSGVVTSAKIADGAIVNADINASAAIAGTKISPNFGSQNIFTNGDIKIDNINKSLQVGDISNDNYVDLRQISASSYKSFTFQHSNASVLANLQGSTNQYLVLGDNNNGNSGTIFGISQTEGGTDYTYLTLSAAGNLTISNNISVGGTVDGRDVASDGSKLDGIESNATADQTASEILTLIKTVDGAGSGLNADVLDGISSASFLRSDAADNCSGVISFTAETKFGQSYSDPESGVQRDAKFGDNGIAVVGGIKTDTLNATGNITCGGTVDGVDIAARNTLFGGLTSSSGVLTNGVTATTQSAGDNSTKVATTAYADTAVSNLVDSAPSALNTLNELAAALGDDANFSTTVTNSIATKMPLAGGQFTGNITFSGSQTVDGRDLSVDGSKLDGIESGATADQTASEILTLIKTVDGAGSGLDADLLDGISSASFLRSDAADVMSQGTQGTATLDVRNTGGAGSGTGTGALIARFQGDSDFIEIRNIGGGDYGIYNSQQDNGLELYDGTGGVRILYNGAIGLEFDSDNAYGDFKGVPTVNGTSLVRTSDTIASATNADTVDSLHASSFVRSDANDTVANNLNFTSTTTPITTNSVKFNNSEMSTSYYTDATGVLAFDENFYGDTAYGTGATSPMSTFTSNGGGLLIKNEDGWGAILSSTNIQFCEGNFANLKINSNQVFHAGNLSVGDGGLTSNNFTDSDHSKLNGIESGATADQSNSEIKTAYEANSNTNAFTDALLSKLNGIAASATNVTNTNQLTNGAGFITATLTNEQVQDIVGGMVSSNTESGITVTYQDGDGTLDFSVASQTDNNFTNADHSKLDGIEAGATADQTASEILTLIKTVDGAGSGLNADLLDGISSASFLRSDTADTASGDITFSGGAGAATIAANSDIRFTNGSWTGNSTKIQHHDNYLYIAGGSNGIIFREEGTNRWIIDGSGHLDPATDSTYDIGASGTRVRNGYFDTLYGDGSNLTGISAGATGGGSDEVFYENDQTVTTNYTITNGKNAMAAGPITINSGVTVTVGSGETLTIV